MKEELVVDKETGEVKSIKIKDITGVYQIDIKPKKCQTFDFVPRIQEKRYVENKYFRMPYGKHKGEYITNLPRNYLMWLAENVGGDIAARAVKVLDA